MYFLFFLIIGENFALDQLCKLPILFEHFMEHKERDHHINLVDFLSMHYWGDDMDDNDDDRDMQLPFKKFDAQTSHLVFFASKSINVKVPVYQVERSYLVYQTDYYPNPALSGLFRPPQVKIA